jgi:hypothetical protein
MHDWACINLSWWSVLTAPPTNTQPKKKKRRFVDFYLPLSVSATLCTCSILSAALYTSSQCNWSRHSRVVNLPASRKPYPGH